MIYLSGGIRPELNHPMLGWMLTPDVGNVVPPTGYWAYDNACFKHPDDFNFERFEHDLRRRMAYAGDRLLFVVTPDKPFDADGTIARFDEYKVRMRKLGAPIAFVTQNGMQVEDLPWNDFDALFVGGSTEWKFDSESAALIKEAKRRGKWVHVGRVNSLRKLRWAESLGCDSVDGTFLARAPRINWPRMLAWFAAFRLQPIMRLQLARP